MSLLFPPVEQNIGFMRDDCILVYLLYNLIIELKPLIALKVFADRFIVPSADFPLVIAHGIELISNAFAVPIELRQIQIKRKIDFVFVLFAAEA